MERAKIKSFLTDAGCSETDTNEIIRLIENSSTRNALYLMKKSRCSLMDDYHKCGRRIDCLDFLIRQTEKEMLQAEK